MLLLSECALLLVRNYFNDKPDGPYNKANGVEGVPSWMFHSRNLATKVGDVNRKSCDKNPQSLYVPKSEESELVVSDGIEANVLSSLPNVMHKPGNNRYTNPLVEREYRT